MRARFRLGALGALAIGLGLGVGCSPGPAAADALVVVAAPLSGPQSAAGHSLLAGAAAAVAEIEAAGGLVGQKVQLSSRDDGCSSATGAATARLIAALAPAVVVGHSCSSAAVAAAPIYAAAGVLFIAVGARHPEVTTPRRGPTTFRLAGRDDRQGEAAAAWLAASGGEGAPAIVHDRTRYGRELADAAMAGLKARGTQAPVTLAVAAGQTEYAEIVKRLVEADSRATFFAGFPPEAIVLIDGLAHAGSRTRLLGSDALATPAFAARAPAGQSQTQALIASDPVPESGWRAPAGASNTVLAAAAHAAVMAYAEAARTAATPTAATNIAARLESTPMTTASLGRIAFDANGDWIGASFRPATATAAGAWLAVPVPAPQP